LAERLQLVEKITKVLTRNKIAVFIAYGDDA